VKIDGELFTEYLTKAGQSPSMWPIVGPSGKRMTRSFPVGPRQAGESEDHPHHQSLWFTHDQVNGANFWAANVNDSNGDQGPHIVHRELARLESLGSRAEIVTRNDWMNGDKRICEDERTIVFGARENGDRWIDFTISIKATDGDVTFGDTKEGTFGIRVPDSMTLLAARGGTIVNSVGQTDSDAWGLPAEWVDYNGPVDGETVGVAIFSHPKSFRPVPRWHVRDYGLFTANPFGQLEFPHPELAKQGATTIKRGESLRLRYRALFHRGNTEAADVAVAFQEFARE
jgi:hypothetical protein